MEPRPPEATLISGSPAIHKNWCAYLDGRPVHGRTEVPLYSDVDFSLPPVEGLGPYDLQHAFPADLQDPALILTVVSHVDPNDLPAMKETETQGFTGSWLADEFAALLSLASGRRFMAGAPTRLQTTDQHWIIMGDRSRPSFFKATATRDFGRPAPRLPRATERMSLTTQLLNGLPTLAPDAATSLVRAARSYRDALWIAETEPALAWVLFVSAIEVAAVRQHIETPLIEILRSSKPKLVKRLEAADPRLPEEVAVELARELKATARFLDFLATFMPEPPVQRPPHEWTRLDWSLPAMKAAFKKIYSLRSLALHEGMPFPPPMSAPPWVGGDDWLAPNERILGLASATTGGVWKADDLPMSLHSFEHIVRGALLKWWRHLIVGHAPRTPGGDAPME